MPSHCLSISRRPLEIEGIPSSGPVIPPFVVEFPNADRASLPYIRHFINFCSRFLVYADDGEANPFQQELVPLASSSPALLHSMIALAAGHMARTDPRHGLFAVKHYTLALRELNRVLSEPGRLGSNSTLGACLMLCVYEVSKVSTDIELQLTDIRADIAFGQKPLAGASSRSAGSHYPSRRPTYDRLSFPILLAPGHIRVTLIWQGSADPRELLARRRRTGQRHIATGRLAMAILRRWRDHGRCFPRTNGLYGLFIKSLRRFNGRSW